MSINFERWKALADLTSKERDPEKLTQLACEMNIVLQKTPCSDSMVDDRQTKLLVTPRKSSRVS
jgi:hypothetical protein